MIEPIQPDPAEAVRPLSAAEQLAARVAGHAHCPVLLRTLHIKLAEPRYMCLDSCSRGRPRTSRRPRVSGDAGHTQITATSGKRKPFGAVTSIRSQRLRW
jgi:hypothetical protein